MRLEIKLPVRIAVRDYHEFAEIREWYGELNPDIKVREIGGEYEGMVYCGTLKEPENARMMKEIERDTRD